MLRQEIQRLFLSGLSLAASGEGKHAVRQVRKAIELVPSAMLNSRGEIGVDLALTLMAARHGNAARDALERAIDSYERKGNLVAADQARSLVSSVGGD